MLAYAFVIQRRLMHTHKSSLPVGSTNSSLSLLDLPFVILSGIICLLDIAATQSLCQTNVTLKYLIRSIWLSLAQKLVARNSIDMYPDYGDIEHLSTEEIVQ
ncbi:hypothetical protein P691DRAFT_761825 [Macrolepiota fuliginosa MF-IS2]|uniref:Uncharacterized protein n=1 Tax=Macrolepiota fuliginosa MF-IS2 TaxID=1400762 RepID=A0A9P5XAU2_9AGAR|nr:hypothetical protein P691DRAFT_761825 [Macrolepiota fuliginosa MF-IS2]